jgi:alginate O-acetyltransferase complex protein AlgI
MNVNSIEWVLGLLALSGVFFLLPRTWQRQGLFALCSFGFLATHVANAAAWAVLAGFLATGYLAVRVLARHPSRLVFTAYLSLLIGSFVFIKQYSFLKVLLPAALFERAVVVVGLSYMLFRQIHLAVDALQGQIERFSLWNYLNYQLNLFGLLAGPIQRYQEFCEYWTDLKPLLPGWYEILKAYLRLFWGVIKVLALATVCLTLYNGILENYLARVSGWRTVGEFVLLLYLFPAYLYFNFSGYCDIVIAGASLLGVRMPENFDYPFLSRNLGDLWTRWHRSLGFWIRDYLFTPIFKGSVQRWPAYAISLSFFAYFLAFAVAGIWHGSSLNFLVFGLLNGLGVAGAKAWEMYLIRRRGRRGLKEYLQSPRIRVLAIAGTISYFSFTLIFFSRDVTGSFEIFRQLANAFNG